MPQSNDAQIEVENGLVVLIERQISLVFDPVSSQALDVEGDSVNGRGNTAKVPPMDSAPFASHCQQLLLKGHRPCCPDLMMIQ